MRSDRSTPFDGNSHMHRRTRGGVSRTAVRLLNRKAVFDAIIMSGPISRVELADQLGLSRTAVADIVGELLERELVRERGPGESAGGRPPLMLEAYSETAYAVGIQVTADEIRGVATDPGGRVLATRDTSLAQSALAEDVLRIVVAMVHEVARAVPREPRFSAAPLGVAWSGHVSADGQVTSPDIPGCAGDPFALRNRLAEELQRPVLVDNDANLGALAELRYGAGRDRRNLVYMLAHSGLGAGIVADGHLYRGFEGAAGEIGHTLFDPNGELCECGSYGCIETVASTRGLVRAFMQTVRLGRRSPLMEAADEKTPHSAAAIIGAAQRGDVTARTALERVGEWLGIAAANVANAYAPEIVILGGPLAVQEVLGPFQALARGRAVRPLSDRVAFELSQLGPDGPAVGAGAAALEELLLPSRTSTATTPQPAEETA